MLRTTFAVVRKTAEKCPLHQKLQFRKISVAIPDRAYVEVTGKDTTKFLQGICTNDISKLTNHGDCIAAAFLTTKGRILADAIMYNVVDTAEDAGKSGSEGSSGKRKVVIETHSSAAAGLIKYLSMYRLRSSVKVTDASTKYSTVLFTKYNSKNESQRQADAEGTILVTAVDPRTELLGARILLTSSNPPFVPDEASTVRARAHYSRLRLLHGIAEGPEIVNRIPLECNMDLLNYIDFNKGCYVGQELIARTKFKGMVRKRLLPFVRKALLTQIGISGSHHDAAFVPLTAPEVADLLPVDLTAVAPAGGCVAEVGMKVVDTAAPSSSSTSRVGEVGEGEGEGSQDALGEVVASDWQGGVGVALVRLAHVLPAPRNEAAPGALASLQCVSTTSPPGTASARSADTTPADTGTDTDTGTQQTAAEALSIAIHRPSWWRDRDPLTLTRIDTHEDVTVLPF